MEASGQTGSERSRGVSCSASVAGLLQRLACWGQRMQRVAGQCGSELVAGGGVERQDKLYMGGGQPCKYPTTVPRDLGACYAPGCSSTHSVPLPCARPSLLFQPAPLIIVAPSFHALLGRYPSGLHDACTALCRASVPWFSMPSAHSRSLPCLTDAPIVIRPPVGHAHMRARNAWIDDC